MPMPAERPVVAELPVQGCSGPFPAVFAVRFMAAAACPFLFSPTAQCLAVDIEPSVEAGERRNVHDKLAVCSESCAAVCAALFTGSEIRDGVGERSIPVQAVFSANSGRGLKTWNILLQIMRPLVPAALDLPDIPVPDGICGNLEFVCTPLRAESLPFRVSGLPDRGILPGKYNGFSKKRDFVAPGRRGEVLHLVFTGTGRRGRAKQKGDAESKEPWGGEEFFAHGFTLDGACGIPGSVAVTGGPRKSGRGQGCEQPRE